MSARPESDVIEVVPVSEVVPALESLFRKIADLVLFKPAGVKYLARVHIHPHLRVLVGKRALDIRSASERRVILYLKPVERHVLRVDVGDVCKRA